jgi:hypothetical protein
VQTLRNRRCGEQAGRVSRSPSGFSPIFGSWPTSGVFFGEPGGQLFGCHHPPIAGDGRARSSATPWVGIYGLIACSLSPAERCRHVLRFDYFGTGTRRGVRAARLELGGRSVTAGSGVLVRRVYAAGLRLGAAIAYRAAVKQGGRWTRLWDPWRGPSTGRYHLPRRLSSSTRLCQRTPAQLQRPAPPEIVGFPMTKAMYEDLAALDLFGITRMPAQERSSWIAAVQEKLRAHIESAGTLCASHPHPQRGRDRIRPLCRPRSSIPSAAGYRAPVMKKRQFGGARPWSVSSPTRTRGSRPRILLNSGIIHRVGPNRLYVAWPAACRIRRCATTGHRGQRHPRTTSHSSEAPCPPGGHGVLASTQGGAPCRHCTGAVVAYPRRADRRARS